MNDLEPKNTTGIVRDAFIDMALYLEALFFLHGVNDILVEDIIHCMEEGYANTLKTSRKSKPRNRRSNGRPPWIAFSRNWSRKESDQGLSWE